MVWCGAGDGNDGNVDWDISHQDGNISWPRGHANTRGDQGEHAIIPWHLVMHFRHRLGLLLYTASLYLIILCMLSHLLILRCGDWLRESEIVFGPGSPAHWAMIGPGLPGPEYFWHRSGRVGSQHLLSELIIAQVWAHWPHIDSGNNIDNQPELWPAVQGRAGYNSLGKNHALLAFHLSKKLILTQCSGFEEMCLAGILWPWSPHSPHKAALSPQSVQQTAQGRARWASEEHDPTWDGY